MIKREAKFGLLFRHYLKASGRTSGAFELKQTTTYSIPFAAVQEHQINALLAVKSKQGLIYKISDDSRGIKPFDMFIFRNSEAYVVIKYPQWFIGIDIDVFIKEKAASKRKSLQQGRAMEISAFMQMCG